MQTDNPAVFECRECPMRPGAKYRTFKTQVDLDNHTRAVHQSHEQIARSLGDNHRKCINCGQPGAMVKTGMCGVCTFGTADEIGEFYD